MNMKIMVMNVVMVVMGLGMVKGVDCPPPGDPPNPPAGEGQVKASPTPTPVPGTAR